MRALTIMIPLIQKAHTMGHARLAGAFTWDGHITHGDPTLPGIIPTMGPTTAHTLITTTLVPYIIPITITITTTLKTITTTVTTTGPEITVPNKGLRKDGLQTGGV